MKNVGKALLASLMIMALVPAVAAGIAAVIGVIGLTVAAPVVMVPLLIFGAGGMALCYVIVRAVITLVFHK